MALLAPTFAEAWKQLRGIVPQSDMRGFQEKNIRVVGGPMYSNRGQNDEHFKWETQTGFKKNYEYLFNAYRSKHPFVATAAAKNPALLAIEKQKWMNKFLNFASRHYHDPENRFWKMVYTQTYNVPASTKPLGNKPLSSSWVRGLRIVSPTQVELNLGNKWYTYGCNKSQQQRLMQVKSIGREIAGTRPGAKRKSTILTKLW